VDAALERFVLEHLPPPPSRVLEVGCGAGDLARTMAAAGHEVVALDPEAPEGAIFRRVRLEEFSDERGFEAAVASRSLHHIEDLDGAIARLTSLLHPGSPLVVNEFAWDRFDEATASWYLGRMRELGNDAAAPVGPEATASLAACREWWRAEHDDLHGFAEMRAALDRRFAERHLSWHAYLYRDLTETDRAEEERLIESGEIRAVGFRFVGELRA
jgi:ubiquinone/menaquinone biosynthesis C-methylase UbiE